MRRVGSVLVRFPRGIRLRTTVIATLVTGAVLIVGAVVLTIVLGQNLRDSLDSTIETQARARAELLDVGSDPESLVSIGQGESLVWIGSASGDAMAIGGTYLIVGAPPDLEVGPARTVELLVDEPHEGGVVEREQTEVSLAVAQAGDGRLVVVGSELESISKTTNEVRNLLLLGLPLIMALVALVLYRSTGTTLAPVSEIRASAEGIGANQLNLRVPVPATDDEVQRLAVTMNAMLERLDAQQQLQRRFTADASHELKSPVANLRAVAETADIDDPDWPRTQTRIVSEADRLAGIIEDLLFMAVHDEGAAAPQVSTTVHLDDVLFDEAELLAARSNVAVDINGVGPCSVPGDADQLRRLVRNLVQNAEGHADSRVTLGSSDIDGPVLWVSDDGLGVPVADRERIFDRFARVETARDRRSGGTGLGLAIVAAIASGHGADVSVESASEGGAEFIVRWSS
jgi:signal transduction histidine kinase